MPVLSANVADEGAVDDARGVSFERAFDQHYPRIYRLLVGLVGPDEADDAAQEVFLRLYASPVLHQPDGQLAAWLYRVALNTGYNLLRSRRRAADRLQRAGRLTEPETAIRQAELNPARSAAVHEEAALVRATLDCLSPTHRNVLLLRQAGLSYAEVAAAVGVKPGSVGALLARAEAHLRSHYLRLAGDPPPASPSPEEPSQ